MFLIIPFIYADNCKHCQKALNVLELAIQKSKKSCKINKFKYNEKAAIAIAIAQNITTLPGFVIGDVVFSGGDYSEERIIQVIEKFFDNEKQSN